MRQPNTRPLTTVVSPSSSPYSSSTTMTINPLPGEDCAVVAEETHAERKDQQQRNDRARGFIECSDSMEVMVQFWCQKLHTRRIRRGTHNCKGLIRFLSIFIYDTNMCIRYEVDSTSMQIHQNHWTKENTNISITESTLLCMYSILLSQDRSMYCNSATILHSCTLCSIAHI